ncbi:hypothetical protein JW905_10500 [bacterium]|nr:hypothetical protein [candidate division CSSED10-310 bacterium]
MTSINAMRIDRDSGLCICDEARYWNPEWMIFYTPEKIRSVVNRQIQHEQGLVLFMGTTGTSSIGDEFIDQTEKQITRNYELECKKHDGMPPVFMGVEEAALLSFEVITRVKRVHVDDMLRGRYGFTGDDLVAGYYERAGAHYEIADAATIGKGCNYMTFDGMPADVKGIYGNSQVLAGYHPDEGFRIFYMTTRMPVCEEVQEIFLAQGSGRDTCDLVYCDYTVARSKQERRCRIDRVEAVMTMLRGLTHAYRMTAGVGGYPKIIYFNGLQDDPDLRVKELFDRRSRLAFEIESAKNEGLVSRENAYELIEDLVFKDKSFPEINEAFLRAASDTYRLLRFLRGYTLRSSLDKDDGKESGR